MTIHGTFHVETLSGPVVVDYRTELEHYRLVQDLAQRLADGTGCLIGIGHLADFTVVPIRHITSIRISEPYEAGPVVVPTLDDLQAQLDRMREAQEARR